jgi:ribosomal subunit interface protein
MDIRVSGHQIATGAALQTHVSERMNAIADKYFARALSAHATFGRGPHEMLTCDIVAHVMQGVVLKGHGLAKDAHVSFEGAADKIEKQLRRYMRRLKDKHGANGAGNAVENTADDARLALAAPGDVQTNAGYVVFDAGNEDEEILGDAPLVIAEMKVDVPNASVSDAVMMLDLRNTNALLFKNSKSGQHNMVYRRNDGTIGWVEPH